MMKATALALALIASLVPLNASEKPSEILAAISAARVSSELIDTTQAQLYPASAYFPFIPEVHLKITDVARLQQSFGATRYGQHLGVDECPQLGIKQVSLGMSKGTLEGIMRLVMTLPLAMNAVLPHGATDEDGALIQGGIAAFEALATQSLQQLHTISLGTTMLAVQFEAGKLPPREQLYQMMGLDAPNKQHEGLDIWTLSEQLDGRSKAMIYGLIGERELYLAVGVKDEHTLVVMITDEAEQFQKLAKTTSYVLNEPKLGHNCPIQVRPGHFMYLFVGGEAVEGVVNNPILPELARLLAVEWRARAEGAGEQKQTVGIAANFVEKLAQTLKACELRTTGFYSLQGWFDGHLNFKSYTNSENYLLAPSAPVLDGLMDDPDTHIAFEISEIKPQIDSPLTQSELKQGVLAISQLLPVSLPSTELGRSIDAGVSVTQQLTPAWALYSSKGQAQPALCLPIKDRAIVTSSLEQLLQSMSALSEGVVPASLGMPERAQVGVDSYTVGDQEIALTASSMIIGEKESSPVKKLAAAALQPQTPRAGASFVLRFENAPDAEDKGVEGLYIRVLPNGDYTQTGYIQLRLKNE